MTGGLVASVFLRMFAAAIARHGFGAPRPLRVPPDVAMFFPSPKNPVVAHTSAGEKINLDAGLMSTSAGDHAADTCIGIKTHQPFTAGFTGAAMKLVNRRVFFKAAA